MLINRSEDYRSYLARTSAWCVRHLSILPSPVSPGTLHRPGHVYLFTRPCPEIPLSAYVNGVRVPWPVVVVRTDVINLKLAIKIRQEQASGIGLQLGAKLAGVQTAKAHATNNCANRNSYRPSRAIHPLRVAL